MSGHSKWSKVKHQKAGTDAAKSAAFTKASRAITVAVKEGGGIADLDKNFKLRLAVEKARSVNMPKDTIERAIAKAIGGGEAPLTTILYEAIGPNGSMLLIEAATENKQRTVAAVKNTLERFGGRLATPGAVSYQFHHAGYIRTKKIGGAILDRMLEAGIEAGADDVAEDADAFEFFTPPDQVKHVALTLEAQGHIVEEFSLIFRPLSEVSLDEGAEKAMHKLMEQLDLLDDVQTVYTNIS